MCFSAAHCTFHSPLTRGDDGDDEEEEEGKKKRKEHTEYLRLVGACVGGGTKGESAAIYHRQRYKAIADSLSGRRGARMPVAEISPPGD